jgi:Plavaka transposase
MSATHGSMFVPVILGSDKTVVSIGTGNMEYHPLYMSIGNVHNRVWRAHRNAVVVVGFLAQPKAERQDVNQENFCLFK